MLSRPSRNSGRYSSMQIPGTLSSTVIQETRNCRTYGLSTVRRSRSSGMKAPMLKTLLSVTMSFTSRSSRCAAFCTFGSASALSLHSASKMSLKKGTMSPRATCEEDAKTRKRSVSG